MPDASCHGSHKRPYALRFFPILKEFSDELGLPFLLLRFLLLHLSLLPLFLAAASPLLTLQSALLDGSNRNLDANYEVSEAILYKLNSSICSHPSHRPGGMGQVVYRQSQSAGELVIPFGRLPGMLLFGWSKHVLSLSMTSRILIATGSPSMLTGQMFVFLFGPPDHMPSFFQSQKQRVDDSERTRQLVSRH